MAKWCKTRNNKIQMKITETILRAYATRYTVQELQRMLNDAMDKLGTGSVITSASTGAGTGYTRTVTMTPEEAVELYQQAIDYKRGGVANAVTIERFTDPGTAC